MNTSAKFRNTWPSRFSDFHPFMSQIFDQFPTYFPGKVPIGPKDPLHGLRPTQVYQSFFLTEKGLIFQLDGDTVETRISHYS